MNGTQLLFFITRNDEMLQYINDSWFAWYSELVNTTDDTQRQYKKLDDFVINDLIEYITQNEIKQKS